MASPLRLALGHAICTLWPLNPPHGLVTWRYAMPKLSPQLAFHRRLWLGSRGSWPRGLWLLGESLLWLRWVLFGAWFTTFRNVRRLGPYIAATEGIPLVTQAGRVLRLSLAWCMRPVEIYRFRLYAQPWKALDFVYSPELPAFHRLRNRALAGIAASGPARLGDKLAVAKLLRSQGLPTVTTLACLPRKTAGITLSQSMGDTARVFFKARHGARGRGAFTAWRTTTGLAGRTFSGQPLTTSAAVEAAWRALLNRDDGLVQQGLANHPALAPLACEDAAITLRYITEQKQGHITGLCAMLGIPVPASHGGGMTHINLPVDLDSGCPQPFPAAGQLGPDGTRLAERLWAQWPEGQPLPGWPDLVAGSIQAHAAFPGCWAIAWDWVITPEGPVLLEGNAGWGTGLPQLIRGGFLAAQQEGGGAREAVTYPHVTRDSTDGDDPSAVHVGEQCHQIGPTGGRVDVILQTNRGREVFQSDGMADQRPDTRANAIQTKIGAPRDIEHDQFAIHIDGNEIGIADNQMPGV